MIEEGEYDIEIVLVPLLGVVDRVIFPEIIVDETSRKDGNFRKTILYCNILLIVVKPRVPVVP